MSFTPMPIIPQNAQQAAQRDSQATGSPTPDVQQLAGWGHLKLSATPSGLVVSRHDKHIHLTHDELHWLHQHASAYRAAEGDE